MPTWKQLSMLGNIQFLRISYVVLIIVPLVASVRFNALNSFFGELPLTMRLGYFAALLLSFAHMVYQGFCPQIIKRFESPNDLYRDMLQIKALQAQYLPNDAGFDFDVAHCREGFTSANLANWGARLVCGLLYGVGIVIVIWIAIERSLVVLNVPR
jgi:hypothetical protein